jgi:ABC-type amino acid transport/signal transduction systems, periplasmic component/domain
MKKLLSFVLTIVMAISLCGCTSKSTEKITQVSELKGKDLGICTFSDSFDANAMKDTFTKLTGVKINSIAAYDTGTDKAILALQSGKISALVTASFEADYYSKMNDKFGAIDFPEYPVNLVAFMGVSKDQTEAYDILNSAITEYKDNGTLNELVDKYVTNLTKETQEEKITMPKKEGAKTIKVAITGSAMPLDYFDSEGNPAGFDIALLAKIAEEKGVNFEISTYEPNGGLAAVTSGKADVYFCLNADKKNYETGNCKSSLEELYNIKATDFYFESNGMKFIVNK